MGIIKTLEFKMKNSGTQNWKVNIERYESANDVVTDCRNRKITNTCFDDMSKKGVSSGWEGVNSYDEALDLLKNGYQPTVDKLQSALKVNKMSYVKRISFQNNIQGFAPVVPLALKGVPNSMVDVSIRPIKVKVIDVYYDMTCSSGTSTQTIIENGQKVLACIIDLERQGYRFNLYAVQTYSEEGDADVLCVKIKDSDKPLDIKRMSFPLTHPAFFRVIGFDWYSRMPIAKYRFGYGKALKYSLTKEGIKEFAKNVLGTNAIFFSNELLKGMSENNVKELMLDV